MAEHAFCPIEHDIIEIVEFCERLEFTETTNERSAVKSGGDSDTKMAQQSQSQNGRNKKRARNGRDNNGPCPTIELRNTNDKEKS